MDGSFLCSTQFLSFATPLYRGLVIGTDFVLKEQAMTKEKVMPQVTVEDLQELGKEFEDSIIANASDEARLKGMSAERRLVGLSEQDRQNFIKFMTSQSN